MSYTKLDVRYITDGANTLANVNTRQGEKHRIITLPQKVQKYGDRYGYDSLSIEYNQDHLIIKYGDTILLDQDINGTNNNEYIREIVSYEWLPKREETTSIPVQTNTEKALMSNMDIDINELEADDEDIEQEKQVSQIVPIIKLIVELLVYGFIGMYVMSASILVWTYGFILFWTSFGRKSFEWQEKMWTWYMRKVATLFKESLIDKRAKHVVRLSAEIFISLFIIEAWWICALYGILMFWCEFGKRNLKCVKRITEWYIRRVKATLKQDDTVVLFSEELFTKELEE